MAELLFAFLKNRGFGKTWVSNFTKSSSVFSGFFRVLLLSCEDEKSGGRRIIPQALDQTHTHRERNQDSIVGKCWSLTHPKPLSPVSFVSSARNPPEWSTLHFWALCQQGSQCLLSGKAHWSITDFMLYPRAYRWSKYPFQGPPVKLSRFYLWPDIMWAACVVWLRFGDPHIWEAECGTTMWAIWLEIGAPLLKHAFWHAPKQPYTKRESSDFPWPNPIPRARETGYEVNSCLYQGKAEG